MPQNLPVADTVANATVRNVATRCRVNNYQDSASLYLASVTAHVNLGSAPLRQFTVDFASWWTDLNSEHTPTTGMTLTASVEYPAGTFTQIKWSGLAKTTQTAGKTFTTDRITLPKPVPRGALFLIHNLQFCASGVLSCNVDVNIATLGDRAFFSATALTDQTMTGGEGTNSGRCFYPLSINALSNIPSVLLMGDSRVAGVADVPSGGLGGSGAYARQFDGALPYCNAGSPGEQIYAIINTANTVTFRVAMQARHTHSHNNYGINDLDIGNRSNTQLFNDLQHYCTQKFTSLKNSWSTILPHSTSTDSWATVANQTPYGRSATDRVLINAAARGGANNGYFANYYFISDESIMVEPTLNSGTWNVNISGAVTSDGLHPNGNGCDWISRFQMIQMKRFIGS